MSRRIYIDCGAWIGTSVAYFKQHYGDERGYEIYAFECDPDCCQKLEEIDGVEILNQAIWTENCVLDFFVGAPETSSLFKEKTTGKLDIEHPRQVQAVDFGSWLLSNTSEDDSVIVKMNVEGAEYPVLNQMISDGSINRIRLLFVDWHWYKIGMRKSEHKQLVKKLESIEKLTLRRWSPIHRRGGAFRGKNTRFLRELIKMDERCAITK